MAHHRADTGSTPAPAAGTRADAAVAPLRGRNIHVVGFAGTEGSAVIDFLVGRGITTITAHEAAAPEEFAAAFERTHRWLPPDRRAGAAQALLAHPIQFRWRDRYLEGAEQAEVIFVPQSWFRYPHNAPLRALAGRVPFSSMTRLFFEAAPCPILGVTGTNGKFTVAYLASRMLARSGKRVFLSGNDRSLVPMLYYVDQIPPTAWLVLELSNRQLIDFPFSPQLAVVTNIAPHHLDDHSTMEAYVATKRNIVAHQGPDDRAVLNADNPYTAAMTQTCPHPYLFSRRGPVAQGAFVDGDRMRIVTGQLEQAIPLAALRLPGGHMVENALAAALAASLAGASAPAIAEALADFEGLPYRLRLAGEVGGVRYYEDSLATNPAAAAAAVASMDRPFYLIAGGARPAATAADFAPLRDALAAAPVKGVYLIGATAPLLAEALGSLPAPVTVAGTLEQAVAAATRLARPGDAVLLSPACESFDQFADYRARGDRFLELVSGLRSG